MKVFAISDLHLCSEGSKPMEIFGGSWDNYLQDIEKNWNSVVDENDIVIVAGDLSWAMDIVSAKKDFEYFEKLNGKKIIVRGNHDYWWKSINNVREMLPFDMFALQNDAMKFGDVIFCGTRGYIPEDNGFVDQHHEKIYKRELIRCELAMKSAIDLKTNNEEIVFVMHYPPFNHKKEFNEVIALLKKYEIKYCVFGHIHSNLGKYKTFENLFDINFYLTSCDLLYNKLVTIIK